MDSYFDLVNAEKSEIKEDISKLLDTASVKCLRMVYLFIMSVKDKY